ncbi:MAG: hypothetical protein ACHQWU_10250 [Gemmatimonadales bacterium]
MNAQSPSPRRSAAILLIVAFLAGGFTGAVVDRTVYIRRVLDRARQERRGGAGAVAIDQIPTPIEALGLTPDETARLHGIARRWRPQAGVALDDLRGRVADMENNMFAEMLCVLTPDQRVRYARALTEQPQSDSTMVAKRFALVRANRCPAER